MALKRAIDLVVAAVGLVALAPVLLLIATLIRLRMGGPVMLRQPRLGYRGRPFVLHKFRTMLDARDQRGSLLPDDRRLTTLGRLLRRASLDELPQLLNVLRGEMSLVGPRPLLPEYRDLYTRQQWRRHEMPPGITGLTQVKGRNALTWEEKFAWDVWYVDHWSLRLDLRILARSVWMVLRQEGISAPGHATAPRFEGTRAGVPREPEQAP